MTKLEALKELLAKVEAGKYNGAMEIAEEFFAGTPNVGYVSKSYRGSLDAAKALHEAVLDRDDYGAQLTDWGSQNEWTCSLSGPFVEPIEGAGTCPARAWLIAILKALIAKEQEA